MTGLAAIVLAGGTSRRLGGVDKLSLTDQAGQTTLRRVVLASRPARPIVVVAPADRPALAAIVNDPGVTLACEDPPGGGPARGLAAGLARLAQDQPCPGLVLVLAGDLVNPAAAIAALLARAGELAEPDASDPGSIATTAEGQDTARRNVDPPGPTGVGPTWTDPTRTNPTSDGLIATVAGRRQWLLGLFRTPALIDALTLPAWRDGQSGEAVGACLGRLTLTEVALPAAAAADLDTWDEATRAGFTPVATVPPLAADDVTASPRPPVVTRRGDHVTLNTAPQTPKGNLMDEFEVIDRWWATLGDQLDLEAVATPDWQDLLDTVRVTAHGVIHAAGPVSAFAAGVAAAQAGGSATASANALAAIRALVPSAGAS